MKVKYLKKEIEKLKKSNKALANSNYEFSCMLCYLIKELNINLVEVSIYDELNNKYDEEYCLELNICNEVYEIELDKSIFSLFNKVYEDE